MAFEDYVTIRHLFCEFMVPYLLRDMHPPLLRLGEIPDEEEEIRKSENQPGFYILPGEEDPENHENLLPLGPFWRFEAAGSRYSQDDMNDDRFGDDDVEDWAVEMLAAEMKKPDSDRQAIVIIEARNAMDAARGEGHVWWQDGVFRGQPVDTRQAGWGW